MPDLPFRHKLLIFGGGGAIGGAVLDAALERGWSVVATTRKLPPQPNSLTGSSRATWIQVDRLDTSFEGKSLQANGPYSAVCWAQGANLNDSVYTVDVDRHLELYKANCVFVLITLRALLDRGLLIAPARLCIISSIWQSVSRQNKLSYMISKAALQGLVLSASTDLGEDGHLLNAVLPGALDTPMTRNNLKPDQLEKLSSSTRFNRLPSMHDVVSLAVYLCSPENTGITGQFIAADLGFSRVHLL